MRYRTKEYNDGTHSFDADDVEVDDDKKLLENVELEVSVWLVVLIMLLLAI